MNPFELNELIMDMYAINQTLLIKPLTIYHLHLETSIPKQRLYNALFLLRNYGQVKRNNKTKQYVHNGMIQYQIYKANKKERKVV